MVSIKTKLVVALVIGLAVGVGVAAADPAAVAEQVVDLADTVEPLDGGGGSSGPTEPDSS